MGALEIPKLSRVYLRSPTCVLNVVIYCDLGSSSNWFIALTKIELAEKFCSIQISDDFLDGWGDVPFTLNCLISLSYVYAHPYLARLLELWRHDDWWHPGFWSIYAFYNTFLLILLKLFLDLFPYVKGYSPVGLCRGLDTVVDVPSYFSTRFSVLFPTREDWRLKWVLVC